MLHFNTRRYILFYCKIVATGRTQQEWMELLHVCDSTSDRNYHNSTNSDPLSGGLTAGLNQCGTLEKAKQRRPLGPKLRIQRAPDNLAFDSFYSAEFFVRKAGCLTTRRVKNWACAMRTSTAAPLPNNKLELVCPKHSEVSQATSLVSVKSSRVQALLSRCRCVCFDIYLRLV